MICELFTTWKLLFVLDRSGSDEFAEIELDELDGSESDEIEPDESESDE